jgi:uncharacterized membrane protein
MGKLGQSLYHFVWHLNDPKRTYFCLPFGVGMFFLGWAWGWGWQVSFLAGWIVALGLYLILLAIVIFTADAARTRERISQVDPTRWFLLIGLSLVVLLGNMSVAIILTAVGQRPVAHARLYYEDRDRRGNPFPGGFRQGFQFPGTPNPTYGDFLYVSFAVGLTYAMSDVSVTNEVQRRTVLIHSIISFFFYSTVLGVVLNAIVTS